MRVRNEGYNKLQSMLGGEKGRKGIGGEASRNSKVSVQLSSRW
jgi:hypothetical protein